jgi:hypothetical protein
MPGRAASASLQSAIRGVIDAGAAASALHLDRL